MILRHDEQSRLHVLLNITKSLCYSGDGLDPSLHMIFYLDRDCRATSVKLFYQITKIKLRDYASLNSKDK